MCLKSILKRIKMRFLPPSSKSFHSSMAELTSKIEKLEVCINKLQDAVLMQQEQIIKENPEDPDLMQLEQITNKTEKTKNIDPIFENNFIYFCNQRIYSLIDIKNLSLYISEKSFGNCVFIEQWNGTGTLHITMHANECTVKIGQNNRINSRMSIDFWQTSQGINSQKSTVIIGDNNIFNGDIRIIAPNYKKSVKIGDYNLFAGNITIRGRSDHTVYDVNTKERLNLEEGVEINNNIWICEGVQILNKASIPSNSIVGTQSLVNRSFNEQYILIAGQPANIKKHNIMWHEYLDNSYFYSINPLGSK